MLTPRFELSQTDNDITIIVHAPYANIKDTEVHVDETDFRFYSTPYYLRLNLPGKIVENDASKGNYDCEKGNFTLKFSKVNKGEFFENLDMITTLLAPPKKKKNLVPNIEVISNPGAADESINADEDEDEDEESVELQSNGGDEWFAQQNPSREGIHLPFDSPKYGFANKISGSLGSFDEALLSAIIDLPTPDKTPFEDRKSLREKQENESFNEEHYMADLVESECVEPYLTYQPEWEKLKDEDVQFSGEEMDVLKELPNKEYLLDENEVKMALFGVVDILYASCYNCRTTLGENTVESSWTINKLSSTLSWFQSFTNMHDVIISNVRRSVIYPLIRNWKLSMKVFEDLKKVVKLGKKYILKRFCEIHTLFNESYDSRYILNQLYIKDYLIWLQQIPNSKIEELYSMLENITPSKEEVGLDLLKLEEIAYSVQNEDLVIENQIYSLPDDLEKLILNDQNKTENGVSTHAAAGEASDSESDSDSDSDSSSSSTSSSTTSSSTSSSSSSGSASSFNNEEEDEEGDEEEDEEAAKIMQTEYAGEGEEEELDSDDEPN